MKEILFTLFSAFLYFAAINCTPIVAEETTCKDFNILMYVSRPFLNGVTNHFVTFNNSDLLSARKTCKWFYKPASEELNRRIKPLIIKDGAIDGVGEQQIFSRYEQQNCNEYKEFAALQNWQPDTILVFDDCNNPTPLKHLPFGRMCLRITPYNDHLEIHRFVGNYGKLGDNHPQSGVIIPQHPYVMRGYESLYTYGFSIIFGGIEYLPEMNNVKLILVFENSDSIGFFGMEQRYSGFENIPICYARQPSANVRILGPNSQTGNIANVIFFGSYVEASAFHVETIDEKELREKLLTWKDGLNFLESHHIIAFHFTKELVVSHSTKKKRAMKSEEIFSEIFGIQPITLRLSASKLAETGLILFKTSRNNVRHLGPVYAIVGFKKFSTTMNSL